VIRTSTAAVAVLLLAACGASSSGASVESDPSSSASTASKAPTAAAKPSPKPSPKPVAPKVLPPKLGATASNAGKMNYKTVRIDCIEYVISPVMSEGDPIDELLVGNACNRKKLPWTQATAAVPKGMKACLSDVGYALADGPNIDVRRDGGAMGECSDREKVYKP
jgi:hypothetical protein